MYKLILEHRYCDLTFQFKDKDRLKDFMFEALETFVPDENEERITVRIEKRAEGGNPEPAQDVNQL